VGVEHGRDVGEVRHGGVGRGEHGVANVDEAGRHAGRVEDHEARAAALPRPPLDVDGQSVQGHAHDVGKGQRRRIHRRAGQVEDAAEQLLLAASMRPCSRDASMSSRSSAGPCTTLASSTGSTFQIPSSALATPLSSRRTHRVDAMNMRNGSPSRIADRSG
jgi:hypothetical protein